MARRDMAEEVLEINNLLQYLAFRHNIIILRHSFNIDESMLWDKKHLNVEGFFVMLVNIRFYMFGICKTKRNRARKTRP